MSGLQAGTSDVARQISAAMRDVPPWPEDAAREMQDVASRLAYNVQGLDVLSTLRCCAKMRDLLTLVAQDVIEIAGKETKITQKALAEALDVPSSVLRGLRS